MLPAMQWLFDLLSWWPQILLGVLCVFGLVTWIMGDALDRP